MKPFFASKKDQDEKKVLFVCYGDSLFCISKNKKNTYYARHSVVWQSNPQLMRGVVSGTDIIPCSSKAVEEAFDLLKDYDIIELLEDVKQSGFRDIVCCPPYPIRVELNYEDTQYHFEDLYGCCYERSRDINTKLLMTQLMLKYTELFFLIQQGKI